MSFLSNLGGIASVITGSPLPGLITGLIDGGEEQQVGTSTAAQQNMPPELRALMQKTTAQISDDISKLVAGDEAKVNEYKNYFKNVSGFQMADFDKLVKPVMTDVDNANLKAADFLSKNSEYATELDKIEALGDKYEAAGSSGTKEYQKGYSDWITRFNKTGQKLTPDEENEARKAGQAEWLKTQLGDKWTPVTEQVFQYANTISRGYTPGNITKSLNKVQQANNYQKQLNLMKDAGLQTPEEYYNSIANKYKEFEQQQKDIYAKYDQSQDELKKLAIPGMNFKGKDINEAISAVKSHFGSEPIKQGFYNLNGEIRYYKDGKFLTKDEYSQLPVGTPDGIDYQTRKDAYLKLFDSLGTAAANLSDETAIAKNLETYKQNVADYTKQVQALTDQYYKDYRALQESSKSGMPDFLDPKTIYDYPGDLTTKASTDELNIQKDIREELAGNKIYNDYAKLVDKAKSDLMLSSKDAMVKAAVAMGKTQAEAFNASPEQLYQWLSQSTDPNAQAFVKDFGNKVQLATDKAISSATPDIRAAFETVSEITKVMNLTPVDFTEFINDFKTGRNATENEKKYQNILMNMSQTGIGEDLTGKIYGAATSDINAKAKEEQARIDAQMSARGLGASSALVDQQRAVENEAQRLREKAGLESSVEAAKLNQAAKEYGISTGTSLEKQLADRYLGGTASAAELQAKQDELNRQRGTENVELAKQRALIQSGTQQAGETKRDKLRTELLNLAQTQEARDAANKQNIYNEFIRRLNARENKITQGANLATGAGTELAQLNTQTATQQYLQNLKNQQAQNQLIAQTLGSIYKPKKNTVSQTVDDDYDLWGGNTSDYLSEDWMDV